jgi:hypothetical protein
LGLAEKSEGGIIFVLNFTYLFDYQPFIGNYSPILVHFWGFFSRFRAVLGAFSAVFMLFWVLLGGP